LKVPRQCPLILMVEVRFREGKMLEVKRVKRWEVDLVTRRRNK
jgi:hypothetical protein